MQFISVIQIYPPDDFFFLKGGEGFGGFGVCLFFIFEEGYFFFQGG